MSEFGFKQRVLEVSPSNPQMHVQAQKPWASAVCQCEAMEVTEQETAS